MLNIRCTTTTAVSLVLFLLPLYVLFMYFAIVLIPSYSERSGANSQSSRNIGQFLIWVTPVLHPTSNASLTDLRQLAGALNSGRLFSARSKLWMVVEQGNALSQEVSALLERHNALPSTHLAAEGDAGSNPFERANTHGHPPVPTGPQPLTKSATLACWLRAVQRLGEHFTQDIFAEYPMRGHVFLNARILSDMSLSATEEFRIHPPRSATLVATWPVDGSPVSDVNVYLVPGSGALLPTDSIISRRAGAKNTIIDERLMEALSQILDQTLM